MTTINIAIADDHKVVINGLQNMLQAFPHIRVMGVYNDGKSLLQGLAKEQPDVLLLDIQMPDASGDELAAIISASHPQVRILVMTGFSTSYYIRNMLEKGASGYLLKNTDEYILVQAIEAVNKGEQFIDPSLRQQFIQDLMESRKLEHARPSLTRREKEILSLILEEYTSQEIADKLSLSLRTVENQRVSLLQKLQVKNTAGLVKMAIEMKLLEGNG
jgi:DNA-binding NarL/FixJ family response regulator